MFSGVLPKTVADVGPGGAIPTAMNALNQLQVSGAQAKYAPYTNYADALSKIAYANYLPYQLQAQAMSNPLLWATGKDHPEAIQNMVNNFAKSVPSIGNVPGVGQLPVPGQGNSLMGMLMSKLGGNNAPSNPMQQLNGSSPIGNSNSVAQIGQAPVSSGYNTPGNQAATASANSGGLSGNNPYTSYQTEQKVQDAAALGQTENQNKEIKDFNEQTNSLSSGAVNAQKALRGWYNNYKKSFLKGQYAGSRPASGAGSIPTLPGHNVAPEQLADNFANQVLQASTDMQSYGGGMTDQARSLIASAKGLTRELDEPAAKQMFESRDAGFTRLIHQRQFLDNFYKNNPTATKEDAIAMLNNYNEYAPSYDYENSKPLPQNEKKFKDFTSKEALDSYKKNGEYNPYERKNNNISASNKTPIDYSKGVDDTQGRMPPAGTVWMQSKKTKKFWPIHKDNLNDPEIKKNLTQVG